MKVWSDWEILRREVSIAGYITDRHNSPVAGIHVNVNSVLTENVKRAKGTTSTIKKTKENRIEHLGHTLSRKDGLYYFLDLPSGQYTISIHRDEQSTGKERKISITRDKKDKRTVAQMDFTLV